MYCGLGCRVLLRLVQPHHPWALYPPAHCEFLDHTFFVSPPQQHKSSKIAGRSTPSFRASTSQQKGLLSGTRISHWQTTCCGTYIGTSSLPLRLHHIPWRPSVFSLSMAQNASSRNFRVPSPCQKSGPFYTWGFSRIVHFPMGSHPRARRGETNSRQYLKLST